MTDSIKNIFNQNINFIRYSDKTINYLRLQNFYRALECSTKAIDTIILELEDIIHNQDYFNEFSKVIHIKNINQMLEGLLEAQRKQDYILLADLYEMQLNPFILSIQEIILTKEKIIFDQNLYDKNLELILKIDAKLNERLCNMGSPLQLLELGYSVEYTSCGLMTIALYDNDKKYYLHSNGHVLRESELLARDWFSNDISNYIIYGFGFGYHVLELMDMDDSIIINVYESDLNIIQLACMFTDMTQILLSNRVNLIYDPSFDKLSSATRNLNEDIRLIIHYPSLRNIKNFGVKEKLEDYFISYSSVNNQLHKLNNNFKKNVDQYDDYVDALKNEFYGKDLYIIAAGPSLDKNYKELKNLGDDAIILATGTVFKKLISDGIIPDYVIIIDANDNVYRQIKDVDTKNVPLLYLSTVYHKVLEDYKGKKYLICQEGYKKAENYASKNGFNIFQTGGSVSTTALDIGIQFGCRRIIYLGLDLSYTNNLDHASGTASVNVIDLPDLRQVKDIYGNMIGTSKNLDIYRKWIERRILNVKGIEFIDATEGGAEIRGMKIATLKETMRRFCK